MPRALEKRIAMANSHQPLQALAPVDWSDLPQDDLATYINDILSQAMIVVESIPSPSSAAAPTTPAASGRARAKTESAVLLNDSQRSRAPRLPAASLEAAAALGKDWKEVKVNPKENPLGVNVFKLSSKDGKGAWFARQSVHEGLSFENWRAGLEREFAESLKVQGSPGVGNIRGIGADRHVEDKEIENAGHLSGMYSCFAVTPHDLFANFNSLSIVGSVSGSYFAARFHHSTSNF